MPPRKKNTTTSVGEIVSLFSDTLTRAVARPTVHGYKPHEKQLIFHRSVEKGKLLIGGNRSGKTVGGVVEDVWWLRGEHPYRPVPPPPIRGRIVTVSFTEGVKEIIIPELCRWIPPSDLINGSWEDSYAAGERKLTLANGSTCELMSYDQELKKFAGTSRHFIHFDEEPPKNIYTECKFRLLDTRGSWWVTMTPVDGMTWVYDEIYEEGLKPGNYILVVQIDTTENPYVSNAEIEIVLSGLDKNEKKARKEGKFVSIGNRAYKEFDPRVHVIPALDEETLEKIKHWTHYRSMDHGLNNPTAWHWHAVSPRGAVVTYDELYASETLVHEFAAQIHEREKPSYRVVPEITVGDPAIAQRNAESGMSIQTLYALQGIYIMLGNNDQRVTVDRVNAYWKQGKYIITENCYHLTRQAQRVRWKVYETAKRRHDNNPREELHKKDDHATDSIRYLFGLMPELAMPRFELNKIEAANRTVQEMLGAGLTPVGPDFYDPYVRALQQSRQQYRNNAETDWRIQDEHLGGIW